MVLEYTVFFLTSIDYPVSRNPGNHPLFCTVLVALEGMEIERIVQGARCLPKLCVLDLDKTLWSVFDAASSEPPYRRVGACEVRDVHGSRIWMNEDTPAMLRALRASGCRIAVASLNPNPERCTILLAALGILGMLERHLIKIRAGAGKRGHLTEIQAAAGTPFQDIIFFDDLKANVQTGLKLGITSIQVSSKLLCAATLEAALKQHAAARSSRRFIDSWLAKKDAPVSPGDKSGGEKRERGCERGPGSCGWRESDDECVDLSPSLTQTTAHRSTLADSGLTFPTKRRRDAETSVQDRAGRGDGEDRASGRDEGSRCDPGSASSLMVSHRGCTATSRRVHEKVGIERYFSTPSPSSSHASSRADGAGTSGRGALSPRRTDLRPLGL